MRGCPQVRRAAPAAVLLHLLILAGCRTPPPPAGRYFDRLDPFDTLSAFAYAIDARQWSFAYDECLTARSRKLFTFTRFKFAMLFNVDVPVAADDPSLQVPIRDLIIESRRQRYLAAWVDRRHVDMSVTYRLPDGNSLIEHLFLELETEAEARAAGHEEPRWLLDLDRTLLELQGVDRARLSEVSSGGAPAR
jgi:hypothetical protein